jgi:hypothetical protein
MFLKASLLSLSSTSFNHTFNKSLSIDLLVLRAYCSAFNILAQYFCITSFFILAIALSEYMSPYFQALAAAILACLLAILSCLFVISLTSLYLSSCLSLKSPVVFNNSHLVSSLLAVFTLLAAFSIAVFLSASS